MAAVGALDLRSRPLRDLEILAAFLEVILHEAAGPIHLEAQHLVPARAFRQMRHGLARALEALAGEADSLRGTADGHARHLARRFRPGIDELGGEILRHVAAVAS